VDLHDAQLASLSRSRRTSAVGGGLSALMLSTALCSLLHAPNASAASPLTPGAAQSGHAAKAHLPPERSILIERYAVGADGEAPRLLEQLSRLESRERRPGRAVDAQSERRRMALEADLRREALRNLVRTGLDAPVASESGRAARARALETLAALESTADILAALEALGGLVRRGARIESDIELRDVMLEVLAGDASGQAELVKAALLREDPFAARVREALPHALSDEALWVLHGGLLGRSEATIARAAMIASAHAAAKLVPSLILAQATESRRSAQSEGWIVFGKTNWYVANAIPVNGNGSSSFQLVPGSYFEGSILEIRESVVTVFRTEVHQALVAVVEETTGAPAPPFGYDRSRWLAWQEREYPALIARHDKALEEAAIRAKIRTTEPRDDV
jgi:hypothetical protein